MKAEDCPKLNKCCKIKMIRDKDILDFQAAEAIRAVCAECSGPEGAAEGDVEQNFAGLDPCVAKVLSQEPVETQRMVLAILNDFKSLAGK